MKKALENPSRREFIKRTGYAGIGLTLGIQLTACEQHKPSAPQFTPNAWLSIYPDNRVLVAISKVEMGQGVISAIPLLIAEELEVSPENIQIELAEASKKFDSMYTGGSGSIRSLFLPLRRAGASARQMLVMAAANLWGLDVSQCYAQSGRVYNRISKNSYTFGELCLSAAELPVPSEPALKPSAEFNLLGQDHNPVNLRVAVDGSTKYAIDIDLPNMKYAAIKQAPVFGSKLLSVIRTKANNGAQITKIIELEGAVAVVADSYWLAQQTLDSLQIKWQHPSNYQAVNSESIRNDFISLLEQPGDMVKESGSFDGSLVHASYQSDFESAYQAHATMEPMNCTVHIHQHGCDIWAPTQHPIAALAVAREALKSGIGLWASKVLRKLGISDNVRLYPTLLGGGFGRRLHQDYVEQAVKIASHFNVPIKLMWSREEDIQHDFYRPYSVHRVKVLLDQANNIISWQHLAVGASKNKVAGNAVKIPYAIPHKALRYHHKDHGIPIGYWRSVSASHNVFVSECFIDELAFQADMDPALFRRNLIADDKRALTVLDQLVDFSDWDSKRNSARFVGIALFRGYGSIFGCTAEIVRSGNEYVVSEIHCVLDCGIIIDKSSLVAQMQGGIIFGLNAAIGHSIHIQEGAVVESNFHDYQLLRINQTPQINIRLLESSDDPGGAGEVGVPAIAPAVANAFFLASGKRQRKIPFELTHLLAE